jgi:hypothetical protein
MPEFHPVHDGHYLANQRVPIFIVPPDFIALRELRFALLRSQYKISPSYAPGSLPWNLADSFSSQMNDPLWQAVAVPVAGHLSEHFGELLGQYEPEDFPPSHLLD